MVQSKAIDIIIHAIETSNKSQDKIAAESGISKSTISRLVTQHTASRPTLDILAAYFEVGEAYTKAAGAHEHTCEFAGVLCAELQETRTFYENKATAVRKHYEDQLTTLREINARQDEERARERDMQAETYDRTVTYLKDEIARLRAELAIADKAATDLIATAQAYTGKKHTVFWVLGGANFLLAIMLLIALLTGPIV